MQADMTDVVQDWEKAADEGEQGGEKDAEGGDQGAGKGLEGGDQGSEKDAEGHDAGAKKPAGTLKVEHDIEEERKRIAAEKADLARRGYELREMKKKYEKRLEGEKAPDEIELTDVQLEQLLEAHDADPKMRVQIIKQIAKQASKGAEVKATDAIEIKNMKSAQDQYLSTNWPDLAKDDSELRVNLEKAKTVLRIGDSPFSDFLSMGALMLMRLPEFVKAAEDRGRSEALGQKIEGKRKDKIKDKLPPNLGSAPARKANEEPGASDNYGLTPEQMDVARKNFGFTKPQQFKWYAQNLKTARG
jgi:hypothetical protein